MLKNNLRELPAFPVLPSTVTLSTVPLFTVPGKVVLTNLHIILHDLFDQTEHTSLYNPILERKQLNIVNIAVIKLFCSFNEACQCGREARCIGGPYSGSPSQSLHFLLLPPFVLEPLDLLANLY